ncbi:hypothetical protein BDV41DRAFT_544645, partial [Aspergillus transmontanensis]
MIAFCHMYEIQEAFSKGYPILIVPIIHLFPFSAAHYGPTVGYSPHSPYHLFFQENCHHRL